MYAAFFSIFCLFF